MPFRLFMKAFDADNADGPERRSDPPSDELPIEHGKGASPRRSFPALGSAFPPATDEAEAAIYEQERRWPVLCSVIFVLASSILLWALIIAGIGWLIPVLASVVALPAIVMIILLCLAFMGKSIR